MGNCCTITTTGQGPVTPVPSVVTSSVGLSTQLIIWGMVAFVLAELIGICCLLRYCCNARHRRKTKIKETIKMTEIITREDRGKYSAIDVNDLGLTTTVTTEVPIIIKRSEFDSIRDIDETRFAGTLSYTGTGDFKRKPVDALEMLLNTSNNKIHQKIISEQKSTIEMLTQRSNNKHQYSYDGIINTAYGSIKHAEMRSATPVRFERAHDMSNMHDELFEDNYVYKNNKYIYDSTGRINTFKTNQTYKDEWQFSEREEYYLKRQEKKPVLHYGHEVSTDFEPIKWQRARDIRTIDWDNLKSNDVGIRADVYEPVVDESNNKRNSDDYDTSIYKTKKNESEKLTSNQISDYIRSSFKSNQNMNNSIIDNHNTTNTNANISIKQREFENELKEKEAKALRTIKRILKDPDSEEILSIKSFVDHTNTITVVPPSSFSNNNTNTNNSNNNNNNRYSKMLDSSLNKSESQASNANNNNNNRISRLSAKSSATEKSDHYDDDTDDVKQNYNISVIDIKVPPSLAKFDQDAFNSRLSDFTDFPSPPIYGDSNDENSNSNNNNKENTRRNSNVSLHSISRPLSSSSSIVGNKKSNAFTIYQDNNNNNNENIDIIESSKGFSDPIVSSREELKEEFNVTQKLNETSDKQSTLGGGSRPETLNFKKNNIIISDISIQSDNLQETPRPRTPTLHTFVPPTQPSPQIHRFVPSPQISSNTFATNNQSRSPSVTERINLNNSSIGIRKPSVTQQSSINSNANNRSRSPSVTERSEFNNSMIGNRKPSVTQQSVKSSINNRTSSPSLNEEIELNNLIITNRKPSVSQQSIKSLKSEKSASANVNDSRRSSAAQKIPVAPRPSLNFPAPPPPPLNLPPSPAPSENKRTNLLDGIRNFNLDALKPVSARQETPTIDSKPITPNSSLPPPPPPPPPPPVLLTPNKTSTESEWNAVIENLEHDIEDIEANDKNNKKDKTDDSNMTASLW